jgi:hypothetical protein
MEGDRENPGLDHFSGQRRSKIKEHPRSIVSDRGFFCIFVAPNSWPGNQQKADYDLKL